MTAAQRLTRSIAEAELARERLRRSRVALAETKATLDLILTARDLESLPVTEPARCLPTDFEGDH